MNIEKASESEILTMVHHAWCEALVIDLSAFDPDRGFIASGGYSLAGLRLIDAIDQRAGVRLDLAGAFEDLSANELVTRVLRLRGTEATDVTPTVAEPKSYLLTPPQRQLWALSRLRSDGRGLLANAESLMLKFETRLQRAPLVRALNRLLARHEALRSEFEADGLHQSVLPECEPVVIDRSARLSEQGWSARDLIAAELGVHCPFDRAPQVRVLIADDASGSLLALMGHHGSCDGTSFGLLARELAAIYTAELTGVPAALPEPKNFETYVNARALLRGSKQGVRDRAFWRARLDSSLGGWSPEPPPNQPSVARTYRGGRLTARVGAGWSALAGVAAALRVTPFAVFFAACTIAMETLPGEGDWALVTLDGRMLAQCPGGAGYCSEVYPMALPNRLQSFEERCRVSQKSLLEIMAHHACSLADLANEPALGRLRIRFGATMVDFTELPTFGELRPTVELVPARHRGDPSPLLELFRLPQDEVVLSCEYCEDVIPEAEAEKVLIRTVAVLDETVQQIRARHTTGDGPIHVQSLIR